MKGSTVLRLFEKLLKEAFGSKREGVTCDWKNKKIVEFLMICTHIYCQI